MELRKALEVCNDIADAAMRTEDAHEGMNAFLEKRKPVWKNK